jgi:AraC family transcriptional activator of tynA and feaB
LAVASVRPVGINLSRSRAVSFNSIKTIIEQNLRNSDLDTGVITRIAGLSARYINGLFEEEGTSLMRYVRKPDWRIAVKIC